MVSKWPLVTIILLQTCIIAILLSYSSLGGDQQLHPQFDSDAVLAVATAMPASTRPHPNQGNQSSCFTSKGDRLASTVSHWLMHPKVRKQDADTLNRSAFVCDTLPLDRSRYIVIPTDDTEYAEFQVRLAYHSYCALFTAKGSPPTVAGSPPPTRAPHFIRIIHTTNPRFSASHSPVPSTVIVDRSPYHAAAFAAHPPTVRLMAVLRWLDNIPDSHPIRTHPAPGPTIALYDHDHMFIRYHSDAFSAPIPPQGARFAIRAPPQAYMNPNASTAAAAIMAANCKHECESVVGIDVPYVAHRDLWAALLPSIIMVAGHVIASPNRVWTADMWGVQLVLAHAGGRAVVSRHIADHVLRSMNCDTAAIHITYSVANVARRLPHGASSGHLPRLQPYRLAPSPAHPAGAVAPRRSPVHPSFRRAIEEGPTAWWGLSYTKQEHRPGRPRRRDLLPEGWQAYLGAVSKCQAIWMRAVDAAWAAWWPEEGPQEGPGWP